ncbi:MAG: cupin domain-containing protein [Chloroflexi bacterium]|nr:cupin domain-containing protein [Chloroflexota bacterium]
MTPEHADAASHATPGSAVEDDDPRSWPQEALVPLEQPFEDERGAIQPLVDRRMMSAVLISSRQGTLRANHYHQTDWHYCYVVEGSIEYFHRPHGSSEDPERLLVPKGSMFFTPPMVDHAMKFPEDTVFLALSRNHRDQESYEADVVRIDVVRP